MRVSLYCIINAIIVDLRQREDSKFFDRTVYANIVSCARPSRQKLFHRSKISRYFVFVRSFFRNNENFCSVVKFRSERNLRFRSNDNGIKFCRNYKRDFAHRDQYVVISRKETSFILTYYPSLHTIQKTNHP